MTIKVTDTYFYFDEAGEKGYVKSKPSKVDFGIIAGFALDGPNLAPFQTEAENMLRSLITLCTQHGFKAHCSAIASCGVKEIQDEFHQARNKVQNFLLNEQVLIFYTAIYSLGFFFVRKRREEIKKQSMLLRRSPIQITSHNTSESLYEILFENILIQLDEFNKIEERGNMLIVSDHIDPGIEKKLRRCLEKLSQAEHERTVKGYDVSKGKKHLAKITITATNFDNAIRTIMDIEIDTENSPLTFMADILCNDLYRHLHSKVAIESDIGLNCRRAIEDFPLYLKIPFVEDENFLDKAYSGNQIIRE